MLSEERIMEIAECCPVWYAIPQGREKALLTKFARAIEREADCPRCAELADQLQFQSSLTKELLPYQDEAVQSRAKLAALEAENAQQAERIKELEAEKAGGKYD